MQDMSLNLVYTMGKVASIAVSESLTCSGIPNHHVHLMTDDSLYEAMAESTRKRAFPADHVGRSISIYRRFKNSKRVKIVTLIRDPLARNISTVFQNLPKKSYGFQALSSLVKQLPTDPITQWNEEQFKLATGISLFDVGFSPEDKFSVYCSGRFEILTTLGSFHGRTLAGIAATGQTKVKEGFEPAVDGFGHATFGDIGAMQEAITPNTGAILVEPVQGESGVHCANPEYLLALRELCNEHNLLLLLDEVQCGHFRTGNFFGWQTIMANHPDFAPDACSMAKSLAAGLPMGAIWASTPLQDLLGPGKHGTTFGGTPLVSVGAVKTIEIIERDGLAQNATDLGNYLKAQIKKLIATYPSVLAEVRGLGLMIGIDVTGDIPAFADSKRPNSVQIVERLHESGLLTIPAGARTFRLLPPLNISKTNADEGLSLIESVVKELAS